MKKKLLQECMICGYKCLYEIKSSDDENIIRATCLPCGHQGLFKLKKIKVKNEPEET